MPTRRRVLGTCVAAATAGCSVRYEESGNLQFDNSTGEPMWIAVTIRSEGGAFSDPETVYDERYRYPPTRGYRSTATDVARPGTYRVHVDAEAVEGDRESGRHTERWEPTGEASEALIVIVTEAYDVEFLTQ